MKTKMKTLLDEGLIRTFEITKSGNYFTCRSENTWQFVDTNKNLAIIIAWEYGSNFLEDVIRRIK